MSESKSSKPHIEVEILRGVSSPNFFRPAPEPSDFQDFVYILATVRIPGLTIDGIPFVRAVYAPIHKDAVSDEYTDFFGKYALSNSESYLIERAGYDQTAAAEWIKRVTVETKIVPIEYPTDF